MKLRGIVGVCVVCSLCGGWLRGGEPVLNPREANPVAVTRVAAGEVTEASAAWWGFNEEDATEAIQRAISSKAGRVTIPYMGKPWIIRPVMLKSNLELLLDPGVVILAKKGEFHGGGDSLFRGTDMVNITIRGYGATLRMHKRDYQQAPYKKAEWRMGLSFNGCTNVRVEGVRIESSGGDGIYVGTTGKQEYCKDMVIKDVVCHDNHRQGISVIGAENLTIENSVFANTWGTAPGAGIDLEPDSPAQRLVNIVIRNCTFENNEGHEILVYAKNLTASSPPISIRFEKCLARKTTLEMQSKGIGRNDAEHGWAGISVGAVKEDGPTGLIEFVDCTVEQTGKESVKIYDKGADRARVRFTNCGFKSAWNVKHPGYCDLRVPILFEVRRPALTKRNGGVEFVDCHVWDEVARPVTALSPFHSELGIHDVTGRIFVHSPVEPQSWYGPASTGVDVQLIHVKAAPREKRKADADAE